jgi:hypothetical protein
LEQILEKAQTNYFAAIDTAKTPLKKKYRTGVFV